ncbi:MAG: OmpA family protein [Flavobacteriales bacterium]
MKALMHCSFATTFTILTVAVSPSEFGVGESKLVRPDDATVIAVAHRCHAQQADESFRWDQRTCRIGAVNRELIFVFAVDDIKLDFPENSALFDTVLQFMRAMPSVELEIGQHLGGYHRMQRSQMVRLTQMRAEAIVNRLIANGIDSKRLVPRGYGDLQPLISREEIAAMERQEKEQAHRMNRRTEFKIIRCD